MADFDELNDDFLSPRSSLKIIDEVLDYELCREADRAMEEEEGMVEMDRMHVNSVSDKKDVMIWKNWPRNVMIRTLILMFRLSIFRVLKKRKPL